MRVERASRSRSAIALERIARLPRVHRHAAADESCASRARAAWTAACPFCHSGCPLGNLIPDWNDLVYRDRWQDAIGQLHCTNNFPEFTGRLCPAPCEAACVLEINEGDAVTIKQIERRSSTARSTRAGSRRSRRAARAGERVAVVGSGPAGLAAAQQLRRAGHARRRVRARRGARAGWSASACPTSRSRSGSSSAASSSSWPRASSCASASTSASTSIRRGAARRVRRDRARDRLARAARPATCRAASCTASTSRWSTSTRATAGRRGEFGPRPQLAGAARQPDQRGGQGRRRDRRRGHRRRLRRPGDARGRRSVAQLELVPEPPEHRPDDRTPWPRWPNKMRLSYAMKEARGRRSRRAGLLGRNDAAQPARAASRRCTSRRRSRRRRSRRCEGTEQRDRGRPRAARDGLPAPRARRDRRAARRRRSTRAATSTRPHTRPRVTACSSPATPAAASR